MELNKGRTRAVSQEVRGRIHFLKNVQFTEPLGYPRMAKLTFGVAATDGGISIYGRSKEMPTE